MNNTCFPELNTNTVKPLPKNHSRHHHNNNNTHNTNSSCLSAKVCMADNAHQRDKQQHHHHHHQHQQQHQSVKRMKSGKHQQEERKEGQEEAEEEQQQARPVVTITATTTTTTTATTTTAEDSKEYLDFAGAMQQQEAREEQHQEHQKPQEQLQQSQPQRLHRRSRKDPAKKREKSKEIETTSEERREKEKEKDKEREREKEREKEKGEVEGQEQESKPKESVTSGTASGSGNGNGNGHHEYDIKTMELVKELANMCLLSDPQPSSCHYPYEPFRIPGGSRALKQLKEVFESQEHSDTELCVILPDGTTHKMKVHKIILSAASPVFEKMLAGSWNSSPHPLKIHIFCEFTIFQEFLKYLYSQPIVLTAANVMFLYLLANRFQLEDLEHGTKEYLKLFVSETTLGIFAEFLSVAYFPDLEKYIVEYAQQNIQMLIAKKIFGELSVEILQKILNSHLLNVSDEISLLEAIHEQQHENFAALVNFVQFHRIPPLQLNFDVRHFFSDFPKIEFTEIVSKALFLQNLFSYRDDSFTFGDRTSSNFVLFYESFQIEFPQQLPSKFTCESKFRIGNYPAAIVVVLNSEKLGIFLRGKFEAKFGISLINMKNPRKLKESSCVIRSECTKGKGKSSVVSRSELSDINSGWLKNGKINIVLIIHWLQPL